MMLRKRLGVLLCMALIGTGILVGCGAKEDEEPKKVIRVYSNRTESHVAYQILQDIIQQYQKEVNPNFSAEFETEPNLDQYKNKLKLYIGGDELPDLFQIDRGPIAEELTKQNKLVRC